MNPTLDLDSFPHTWRAQLLSGAPLIAPARQFVFPRNVPGEEDALLRGALYLQLTPTSGSVFLAACARGFRDPSLPSGLWSHPHPETALAVAGGYAYLIPTLQPEATTLLEQRPATAVLPAPDHGLLLLAGFHDVLALGPEGLLWRTARLSWEGVTLSSLSPGGLHGLGWDMFTDREVPFTVDLRTGAHTGGGYTRPNP